MLARTQTKISELAAMLASQKSICVGQGLNCALSDRGNPNIWFSCATLENHLEIDTQNFRSLFLPLEGKCQEDLDQSQKILDIIQKFGVKYLEISSYF